MTAAKTTPSAAQALAAAVEALTDRIIYERRAALAVLAVLDRPDPAASQKQEANEQAYYRARANALEDVLRYLDELLPEWE